MSIPSKTRQIVAILGPTASGKTALSLDIARRFNGEVVSADSRQIYRGMDIGTAKPNKKEKALVPHHLIDIKDPDEEYTVADYKKDALLAIDEIYSRNNLPVLVGGTGLYARAVLENLDIPHIARDIELRNKLEAEIKEKGLEFVFNKLLELDPEAAYIVDPKNPRRVVRALEVAITTGKPFTEQRKKQDPLFNALKIGIDVPPNILRSRINERIDQMIKDGLVDEVKNLIDTYGTWSPALDAIGYREIIDYLNDKMTLDAALSSIKLSTWHYAKRQLTWFRADKEIHWIQDSGQANKLVEQFLK